MKYAFISFVLSIFLVFIGIYITNSLTPFVEENLLEYAKSQEYLTDNEVVNSIETMIDKGIIFRMLDWKNVTVFLLVELSTCMRIDCKFRRG